MSEEELISDGVKCIIIQTIWMMEIDQHVATAQL